MEYKKNEKSLFRILRLEDPLSDLDNFQSSECDGINILLNQFESCLHDSLNIESTKEIIMQLCKIINENSPNSQLQYYSIKISNLILRSFDHQIFPQLLSSSIILFSEWAFLPYCNDFFSIPDLFDYLLMLSINPENNENFQELPSYRTYSLNILGNLLFDSDEMKNIFILKNPIDSITAFFMNNEFSKYQPQIMFIMYTMMKYCNTILELPQVFSFDKFAKISLVRITNFGIENSTQFDYLFFKHYMKSKDENFYNILLQMDIPILIESTVLFEDDHLLYFFSLLRFIFSWAKEKNFRNPPFFNLLCFPIQTLLNNFNHRLYPSEVIQEFNSFLIGYFDFHPKQINKYTTLSNLKIFVNFFTKEIYSIQSSSLKIITYLLQHPTMKQQEQKQILEQEQNLEQEEITEQNFSKIEFEEECNMTIYESLNDVISENFLNFVSNCLDSNDFEVIENCLNLIYLLLYSQTTTSCLIHLSLVKTDFLEAMEDFIYSNEVNDKLLFYYQKIMEFHHQFINGKLNSDFLDEICQNELYCIDNVDPSNFLDDDNIYNEEIQDFYDYNLINNEASEEKEIDDNSLNENCMNDNCMNDNCMNENCINENCINENCMNENCMNENCMNVDFYWDDDRLIESLVNNEDANKIDFFDDRENIEFLYDCYN
ncbi:hypothetical protein TRFO_13004 [Tritrichomonas foetus]|uniref:Uncharacterized protein n=1 Tax=Tritrichomonas foetus TaxID=1144522 RepID=A0A1J4L458_9EUKA|nr:hypothetical protein TRFO_13004 [Tritrichomonas foetus]|eukprot:OHT16734.1 hypothetical protein TRFO_13004 [Tritrichomonas foetus]